APFLSITQWYFIAGGLLLVVAIGAYVFVSSDAGRVMVAIRENEERCRYLGLNTSRFKIRLMAACSAVAAMAGGFYVLFSSVAAHSYGDFVFGTELVVWTALGGRGTLVGPIFGTVAVNYVSALLGGNLPFIWLLFVGFAFVLSVVYLPQGLVPAIGYGLSMLVRPINHLLNRGWNAAGAGAQPGAQAESAAVTLSSANAAGALAQQRSVIGAPDEAPVLELRDVGMQYGSLTAL